VGRLLTRLGAVPYQSWEHGRSWRAGDVHVVVERSPDLAGDRHPSAGGPDHRAAYLEDEDGYEVELLAR
jgi:hypothetical protein